MSKRSTNLGSAGAAIALLAFSSLTTQSTAAPSQNTEAASMAATSNSPVDGKWILQNSVAERPPTITFADGHMSVYAGCSRYGGPITVSEKKISPHDLTIIEGACSDKDRRDDQVRIEARRVYDIVTTPVLFELSSDLLTLTNANQDRIQLRRATP